MPELTYLEMLDPARLRPSRSRVPVAMQEISGEEVRRLTLAVGRDFGWPSLQWDDAQWRDYLDAPQLRHWAGSVADGEPIGLLSLNLAQAPTVEIDSFGLLPDQHGRGLGGAMLTEAIRMIWALPAGRIRLHTSSDDHPNALRNYRARGFTPFVPAD